MKLNKGPLKLHMMQSLKSKVEFEYSTFCIVTFCTFVFSASLQGNGSPTPMIQMTNVQVLSFSLVVYIFLITQCWTAVLEKEYRDTPTLPHLMLLLKIANQWY